MAVVKVVTFYGERDRGGGVLRQRNRRELLLLEEEQGFSAEASLVVFVVTELAPHIKYRRTIRCGRGVQRRSSPSGHTPPCVPFPFSRLVMQLLLFFL